jgi:hypothetical protein
MSPDLRKAMSVAYWNFWFPKRVTIFEREHEPGLAGKESVNMSGNKTPNQDIPISAHLLHQGSTSLPLWVRIVVVLGALLMVMGAGIALVHPAMLVSPHDDINGAVRVYAGYLVSRNFALAILLLVSMGLRARGMLNSLVLLTACIQILDAGIDCWEGRWAIVPGVVVFGVMFFVASARLSGHPFWRVEAWKQSY